MRRSSSCFFSGWSHTESTSAPATPCSRSPRQALVTDFIAHDVSGYPFVDPNKLTVNAQDSVADGSQFVVSVTYDARNLPIWNLFKTLPLPGTTIQRQSTIRVGGI